MPELCGWSAESAGLSELKVTRAIYGMSDSCSVLSKQVDYAITFRATIISDFLLSSAFSTSATSRSVIPCSRLVLGSAHDDMLRLNRMIGLWSMSRGVRCFE